MNSITKDRKILLDKIDSLPPYCLQEVIDFVEYLRLKSEKSETMLLSEQSLANNWL